MKKRNARRTATHPIVREIDEMRRTTELALRQLDEATEDEIDAARELIPELLECVDACQRRLHEIAKAKGIQLDPPPSPVRRGPTTRVGA